MGQFNMHAIKRQARKEAWYGEGSALNPFHKTTRSSTWSVSQKPRDATKDIEAGEDIEENNLSNVRTEPITESPRFDNEKAREADNEVYQATGAGNSTVPYGRHSNPDTEDTLVSRQQTPTGTAANSEKKGLFSRFHKRGEKNAAGKVEADDKPKKRPWYKGKELKHKPYTVRNQLGATILNSWVNLLLIAAPVGIALNYVGVDGKIIFVVNFIAIIPLAAMLSFATEEISLHVGESLGGLLNATFGNAVELIVAVLALLDGQITVVQTSLIGSILSNLLLVLGMCFFFGGLRRKEQFFNQTVAQTAASLLALAVGSTIIPTCFDKFSQTPEADVGALSRGVAIILLVVYGGYLYFQLSTHSDMFNEVSQKVPMRPRKHAVPDGGVIKSLVKAGGIGAGPGRATMFNRPPNDELVQVSAYEDDEEEPEEPQLHIFVAWATLAGATALIGLCAEFMVDGISSITDAGVSVEFVGLILLPIVGNAAEHATAVTVACKDKMDLAIGVAVGSSMQVALFLIPLLVVIGWMIDQTCMNLSYDGFQVAVLFIAVLLVNYLIGDGKSHWLEGMLLACLYLIIAVCAWYYPPIPDDQTCAYYLANPAAKNGGS
ncbi:Sodium/calcium exchanger protein-domain-containing protein [Calycina marina]|uniref:Sodium/calcium exchanger protein-domain-containing protein n=1 Tax=Calycina marina TaxID=1763456 RepID=A0A9P7Z4R9_9HELO|nr:Sodium/calcium exchanger protein-domain-containing protein [Calycina marina]